MIFNPAYEQAILTGFFTGIGVGLANWLLIKRLEHIETHIKKNIKNGKKQGKL